MEYYKIYLKQITNWFTSWLLKLINRTAEKKQLVNVQNLDKKRMVDSKNPDNLYLIRKVIY